MKKKLCYLCLTLLASCLLASCSQDGPDPDAALGSVKDDAKIPDVPLAVKDWDGRRATDASADVIGTDKDLFHELNTFSRKVTVNYSGSSAMVTNDYPNIMVFTEGAYVTIDLRSGSASEVEIELTGKTDDGGLKIYGANKFLLTLNGVDLRSKRGPAINNQCKKRMFVNMAAGTRNRLEDSRAYYDDPYYINGSNPQIEDRKGALFSEGDMVFSGTGSLEVAANNRHGIASDGYMAVRPGATIAVTKAAANCIHLKGDLTDGYGFLMLGGLVYCKATAPAGKGIKSDENIQIKGGELSVYTSGNAVYNANTLDTSSASCLKTDKFVSITGGHIELCSVGEGGKGINAGTTIDLSGGEIAIGCKGEKFEYSPTISSSSKCIKGAGDITISACTLRVASTGRSSGSRGIESEAAIKFEGCAVEVYAFDDAVNANGVNVGNGADLNLCSVADDGLKGKESVSMTGGRVITMGGSDSGKGVDCNVADGFTFSGGEMIALGCKKSTLPKNDPSINVFTESDFSASAGQTAFLSGITFTVPRTYEKAYLMILTN